MRPWRPLVVAASVATLLAGCGGGSTGPSLAAFQKKVAKTCAAGQAQIRALRVPADDAPFATIKTFLVQGNQAIEDQLNRLAAVTPSKDVKAPYEAAIADGRKASAELAMVFASMTASSEAFVLSVQQKVEPIYDRMKKEFSQAHLPLGCVSAPST